MAQCGLPRLCRTLQQAIALSELCDRSFNSERPAITLVNTSSGWFIKTSGNTRRQCRCCRVLTFEYKVPVDASRWDNCVTNVTAKCWHRFRRSLELTCRECFGIHIAPRVIHIRTVFIHLVHRGGTHVIATCSSCGGCMCMIAHCWIICKLIFVSATEFKSTI